MATKLEEHYVYKFVRECSRKYHETAPTAYQRAWVVTAARTIIDWVGPSYELVYSHLRTASKGQLDSELMENACHAALETYSVTIKPDTKLDSVVRFLELCDDLNVVRHMSLDMDDDGVAETFNELYEKSRAACGLETKWDRQIKELEERIEQLKKVRDGIVEDG